MTKLIDEGKEIIKYVEMNWDGPISLKQLSTMFRLDPGDIDRTFRNLKGITLKRYVDLKRKARLIAMMDDQRFGYEIGIMLGFANDRSFYRWVRRVFGIGFKQLSRKSVPRL